MASLAHFAFDTFPRVVPAGDLTAVLAPFRVTGGSVAAARVLATVDGAAWARAGVRRIPPEFVDGLRRHQERDGMFDFTALPPYLEMANRMPGGAQYLEARLSGVPTGARVTYALEVTLSDGSVLRSPEYALHAVTPAFDVASVRRTFIPRPGDAGNAWVLMHVRDAVFDHVRVDVLCLQPDPGDAAADHERVALTARIGAATWTLRSPDLTELPLVDMAADAVTFSVPHGGGAPEDSALPEVTLAWNTGGLVTVDLATRDAGRARFMIINFAIQGLNDYFATPADAYDPARTYAQVTMRDEAAVFSSRPGSRENGVGDGYAFTLAAHRRYAVPQLWAMNGGLIGLLAHDCPEDLAAMRLDVADGLLEPVHTGFGAHRVPYYTCETNVASIRLGAQAWAATVAPAAPVYYPDSRIFVHEPQVTDALVGTGMEYVVVDGGPSTVVRNAAPPMDAVAPDGRWVDESYVWRDAATGLRVLFIDRQCKDKLLGGPESEADRGKVTFDLRRAFLELAAQPVLRRDNLLVYSDDADKASGNGWFDGNYGGSSPPMNKYYQAALAWLAGHPWVQVVTTADLAGEEPVGTLDLVRASDPYIEEHWRLPVVAVPDQDHGLAFDTWYARWAQTRVAWLGETLRDISDRAERAVAACGSSNELVELAWAHLTMNLHESQWSKRARGASEEPEDFVVAETIQLRDTHVWLHAAVWADWATAQAAPCSFRDGGPVVEQVRRVETELDPSPPWAGADRGLQWDHDPLPNVVLYSEQALVVVDRNGGRITHLFARVGDRPVAVAGTLKAHQWLELDWTSGTGAECDGIVLQNTVMTPNHAGVAGDVGTGTGTFGESPAEDAAFDWIHPANFDAYDLDGERLVHGPSTLAAAPTTLAELDARLAEDRVAKVAGLTGHVVHDAARGAFAKTITLEGRTVRVAYTGTRAGHVVANAFCVDLYAAALAGSRTTATVAGDRAVVRNGDLEVTLVLERGCVFGDVVHRVMTGDVRIVAPDGGDFSYRIELPDR